MNVAIATDTVLFLLNRISSNVVSIHDKKKNLNIFMNDKSNFLESFQIMLSLYLVKIKT